MSVTNTVSDAWSADEGRLEVSEDRGGVMEGERSGEEEVGAGVVRLGMALASGRPEGATVVAVLATMPYCCVCWEGAGGEAAVGDGGGEAVVGAGGEVVESTGGGELVVTAGGLAEGVALEESAGAVATGVEGDEAVEVTAGVVPANQNRLRIRIPCIIKIW